MNFHINLQNVNWKVTLNPGFHPIIFLKQYIRVSENAWCARIVLFILISPPNTYRNDVKINKLSYSLPSLDWTLPSRRLSNILPLRVTIDLTMEQRTHVCGGRGLKFAKYRFLLCFILKLLCWWFMNWKFRFCSFVWCVKIVHTIMICIFVW